MKDSFIFEGKKYISSRRASEISDYSSDYIGQLCRAEKLDCRMIGRTWFVTEESIHLHQATVLHDEIARNRIENLRGKKNKAEADSKKNTGSSENSNSMKSAEAGTTMKADAGNASIGAIPSPFVSNESKPQISYLPDDRPLLPMLNKPQDEEMFADTGAREEIVSSESPTVSTGPVSLKVVSLETTDGSSNERVVTAEGIISENNATPAFVLPVASYPEIARSIILKRALGAVIAVALLLGADYFTLNVAGRAYTAFSERTSSSLAVAADGSQEANILDAFRALGSFISNGYKNTLAIFRKPDVISLKDDGGAAEGSAEGFAVVPSSGSMEGDEAIKRKIQTSFSDEVEVHPDQSGTAGVIKPVFKDSRGNDFVYVMVPIVKEVPQIPGVIQDSKAEAP